MINDIKPRKLEDVPVGELFTAYSDSYKIKNRLVTGTRIPVSAATYCWTCKKVFMGVDFETACSERCEALGDIAADNWRQE